MNFNLEPVEDNKQSSDQILLFLHQSIHPEKLNNIQESVFLKCWMGLTYKEIAQDLGYDPIYIRSIGSQIWKLLSQAFGEKVSKSNFQALLNCRGVSQVDTSQTEVQKNDSDLPSPIQEKAKDGAKEIVRPEYLIERSPFEEHCNNALLQKGALIRIKAPRQMGKTLFMTRILNFAQQRRHRTVTVSLRLADQDVFSDLERFLQWFCAIICDQLYLKIDPSKEWKPIFGNNYNCTYFFGRTLLPAVQESLIIALDDVDIIFDYPAIANDFLGLLRAWCEKARHNILESEPWHKLKLIVVHSTEVYISIHHNQSPFNIGLSIELPEFTPEEIQFLAQAYQVDWSSKDIQSLIALVGGKPYLIQQTLKWVSKKSDNLQKVIQDASITGGIYLEHLRQQLRLVQKYPDLLPLFRKVVVEEEPQKLKAMDGFRLESLGLVKLSGQFVFPSCQLYRNYFSSLLNENL